MTQNALFNYVNETVSSNDHFTPKWVFDLLGLEFDIDVAAPLQGVPWIPAKRWFSQADDGLTQNWAGLVWCNPPFSDILPWIRKLNEHRNGIALLPHTKGGWREELWNSADGIVETKAINQMEFNFQDRNNKRVFPTLFLAGWGTVAIKALENVGRVR